jgi:hypothetical protein
MQDQEYWQGVEQNEHLLAGHADILQSAKDPAQWAWQDLACVQHTWDAHC